VRSRGRNASSSPSNQTSYKSGMYHAFESAMVQKVNVENVVPYVLHVLDLIIIAQCRSGQFWNITTRFLVSTNNT
jgi:hypothetical protein